MAQFRKNFNECSKELHCRISVEIVQAAPSEVAVVPYTTLLASFGMVFGGLKQMSGNPSMSWTSYRNVLSL
jgi:hypothetical protein